MYARSYPDFIAAIGAHNSRVACVSAHLRRVFRAVLRGLSPFRCFYRTRVRTYVRTVPYARAYIIRSIRYLMAVSVSDVYLRFDRLLPSTSAAAAAEWSPRVLGSLVFLAHHGDAKRGSRTTRYRSRATTPSDRVDLPRAPLRLPIPRDPFSTSRKDDRTMEGILLFSFRFSVPIVSPLVNRRFIGRAWTRGCSATRRKVRTGGIGRSNEAASGKQEAVAVAAVRCIRTTW